MRESRCYSRKEQPLTQRYTPDEQEILDWLTRDYGRELTPQEIRLSLAQARVRHPARIEADNKLRLR
jgi:hypothetical protein